jgi:hypothetical protein
MRIGILTIATGKYSMYIPELIDSCESLFLCDHEKQYFIYTDSGLDTLGEFNGSEKTTIIHQEKLGWPYDSMMRFHMFDAFKDMIAEMDYVFFMNANMKVVSLVDESILPKENQCGIVATEHPGYYKKGGFPHENNIGSEFYVEPRERKIYFQGCFNGGRSQEFLKMSEVLKNKMDKDLSNSIIPTWHDESALNWYLINKDPLVLPPIYAYPEHCDGNSVKKSLLENNEDSDLMLLGYDLSVAESGHDPYSYILDDFPENKIIQRNKNLDGGKIYLRK